MTRETREARERRQKSLVEHYLRLDPIDRRHTFVSTREAARFVGVAQRTLQHWIREGKIEAVRVGGRYMVLCESLEQFIRLADGG
jgi:excisionase family DNA binding protein